MYWNTYINYYILKNFGYKYTEEEYNLIIEIFYKFKKYNYLKTPKSILEIFKILENI